MTKKTQAAALTALMAATNEDAAVRCQPCRAEPNAAPADAAARHGVYRNKVVRDLAWAISTPSMLTVTDATSAHIMGDAAGKMLAMSQSWLLETDEKPKPLLAWLSRRRRIGRVVSYFTSLLEFWLIFCPFGMEASELFPTLNKVEGSALKKLRCKNCERPAAPGLTSGSKPWETCCRNCARQSSAKNVDEKKVWPKGPKAAAHTAQCEFRKNSGMVSTEGMWSAEELVGKRVSEIKVPLRQVVEAQPLGSHATRRSIRLGQLSLVARVALRWRSDTGELLASDVVVHIEPAVIFAADVRPLLPGGPDQQAAIPQKSEPEPELEPEPEPEPVAALEPEIEENWDDDSDDDDEDQDDDDDDDEDGDDSESDDSDDSMSPDERRIEKARLIREAVSAPAAC